jgi:hypothetical protein
MMLARVLAACVATGDGADAAQAYDDHWSTGAADAPGAGGFSILSRRKFRALRAPVMATMVCLPSRYRR